MAPHLIEVTPAMKDFAEDALKLSVVSLTAWAINQFVLNVRSPVNSTLQTIALYAAGLALHHLIVDPSIVRFVPVQGTEGYYMASRRLM